jgi:hypothetical protein
MTVLTYFQNFDENRDQRLSADELNAYVRSYLHRRSENTGKVFARFDLNNDTLLDLEGELKPTLDLLLQQINLEFSKLDFSFPWNEFPHPIKVQATRQPVTSNPSTTGYPFN